MDLFVRSRLVALNALPPTPFRHDQMERFAAQMLQRAGWDRKRLKRILSDAMSCDDPVLKSLCISRVFNALHKQPALQMLSVSRGWGNGVFLYDFPNLLMADLDHMLPEMDVCELEDFEDAVEGFRTFRLNHLHLRQNWWEEALNHLDVVLAEQEGPVRFLAQDRMVLAVGFALQSRDKISIRHGVFSLLELKGYKREERLVLGAKIMVAYFKVFLMNDAFNVVGHRRAAKRKCVAS